MKALSNFQEKKSLCENTIKMRKEYEQMFSNNLKEIELIKEKIDNFLNQEELEKSPGLLIPIAHWLSQFDEIMNKIGVDIYKTDIVGDISYYMHLFYDHINKTNPHLIKPNSIVIE